MNTQGLQEEERCSGGGIKKDGEHLEELGETLQIVPETHRAMSPGTSKKRENVESSAPAPAPQISQCEQASSSSPQKTGQAALVPSRLAKAPRAVRKDFSRLLNRPLAQVAARYEMAGRVVGEGMFGVVRACVDSETGARCACKSISKGQLAAKRDVDDLLSEIATMERAGGHAGVVGLEEVCEDQESVHLVMELCEGGELYDQIVSRGALSEAEAAALFRQLASAVAHCHLLGVVHRDLKPENVLLTGKPGRGQSLERAKIKLADFGLARIILPGERLRGQAGSPYYMAPEVLTGIYGQEADVWSLGVILYVMLLGYPPFCGSTNEATFGAIRWSHVDVADASWQKLSWAAQDLILRLLSKKPQARPAAGLLNQDPWLQMFPEAPPPEASLHFLSPHSASLERTPGTADLPGGAPSGAGALPGGILPGAVALPGGALPGVRARSSSSAGRPLPGASSCPAIGVSCHPQSKAMSAAIGSNLAQSELTAVACTHVSAMQQPEEMGCCHLGLQEEEDVLVDRLALEREIDQTYVLVLADGTQEIETGGVQQALPHGGCTGSQLPQAEANSSCALSATPESQEGPGGSRAPDGIAEAVPAGSHGASSGPSPVEPSHVEESVFWELIGIRREKRKERGGEAGHVLTRPARLDMLGRAAEQVATAASAASEQPPAVAAAPRGGILKRVWECRQLPLQTCSVHLSVRV
eukprot:jgi/Mesen1/6900/ME000353S05924